MEEPMNEKSGLNREDARDCMVSPQLHRALLVQARAAAERRQAELQAEHTRKVRTCARLTRYCAVAAVMLFFLCGLGVTQMMLHRSHVNVKEPAPGECVTFRASDAMAYPEGANGAGEMANGALYGNGWSGDFALHEKADVEAADKDAVWVIWIAVTGSVCLVVTAVAIGGILWKRRL